MAQPEPIKRFFGAYNPVQAEMTQALEDAAEEAERLIPKLLEKHTTSGTIKAAQLQLIMREIRAQQSAMWGDLGPILREGVRAASIAAVQGETAIDAYLKRAGLYLPELKASLLAQAERGFKNVVAKGVNGISLSRQVYKTQALAMGWVDRKVRAALILQTDARTLARQVREFIDPNVKGGVSYAAFRLARTEMNNAFHTVAIERFDEPWSTGVEWHLSLSHPRSTGKPEACELLASHGTFPNHEVPKKPHPQCLCYITQAVVSEDEFLDRLLDGSYDEYLGGETPRAANKKGERLLKVVPPHKAETKAPVIRPESAKAPVSVLSQSVAGGVTSEEPLSGGLTAETSLVTLADGTKAVRKVHHDYSMNFSGTKTRTAKEQTDAEYLYSKVLQAMGVSAPEVVRVDDNTVFMEHVEGDTGVALLSRRKDPREKDRHRIEDKYKEAGGAILGALDQAVRNRDRNAGNWIIAGDKKDKRVHPIDNGNAWEYFGDEDEDVVPGGTQAGWDRYWAEYRRDDRRQPFHWADNDFSAEDIDEMIVRLKTLAPEFDGLRRSVWLRKTIARLKLMRPYAKGTTRRVT